MKINTIRISRLLLLAAALWSIFASGWVFFTPVTVVNQTAISSQPASDGETRTEVTTTVANFSWYQTQGWWGVIVLLIFAVLFAGAAISYSQSRLVLSGVLSLLALLFTGLAGLSIGLLYLPAALLILLGWMLRGINRLAKARQV